MVLFEFVDILLTDFITLLVSKKLFVIVLKFLSM